MTKFFLDFFFPLHCLACGAEGHLACPTCRRKIPPAEQPEVLTRAKIWARADYRDPLASELVRALKYRGWKVAAMEMAEIMLNQLPLDLDQTPADKIILVPAPLSTWRRLGRGYNQAELIAKALARLAPERFELGTGLVKKIRHTKSQVEIKERSKRLVNLIDAFTYTTRGRRLARGWCILLIDDVTTTGATFIELKKLFHTAEAKKIICWAFAHG
ncbi:MAG: hypothetical protein AAB900_01150 [Patescibacteria group bacterium]